MRITRIESQKKNRGRKNLYADDTFLVGVSAETLLRAGIRRGDEVDAERLENLRQMESMQAARRTALRYIARRPRTEQEIRNRLQEYEFGNIEVEQTIEQLKSNRLINDEEFARVFIRNALSRRPVGIVRMRQKMLLLGLDKHLVESAIGEMCGEDVQTRAAQEVAVKFIAKHPADKSDSLRLRKSLTDHLMRRGFPWSIVQPLVKEVLPGSTMKRKSE